MIAKPSLLTPKHTEWLRALADDITVGSVYYEDSAPVDPVFGHAILALLQWHEREVVDPELLAKLHPERNAK